jgi:hypothetical protein
MLLGNCPKYSRPKAWNLLSVIGQIFSRGLKSNKRDYLFKIPEAISTPVVTFLRSIAFIEDAS